MTATDSRQEQAETQAPNTTDGTSVSPTSAPELPSLAPGVQLSGEMQESGFEQQQWLVQRNGQFIQVTELLYRLLEQVNGQRTVDEIAAGMSEATGRRVSADNVRQLLADKLIPKGFVTGADGSVAPAPGAEQGAPSRSALRINMRTTVIGPEIINPITAVFQNLYRPPILLAILLATVCAQGWLYFVHGIAGSVHQALYQPQLMLVLLGCIVVSAAFHEFGHASALRYGGGQVRGMGVGMYLIYPAFYTDVTDNYRLSRWNRIRTDLGGFYFNLIFALVMMGIYALTRQDFLFIVVLLVDLEIIHQMLPFVRLDGYWALADLTGLPDFFSQIMPFLRTVLPIPGWKGRELPNLKGWVEAVFALYILITVPLLAILLFLMVSSVPRVLGTAWDSFAKQTHTFSSAQHSGDILHMTFSVVQMVLLALPTIGLLYVLYTLGRQLALALWRWSRPTAGRRITGGLAAVLVASFLAYLWAPRLPLGGGHARGPLASTISFRPIEARERGTFGDAVRGGAIPIIPAKFLPASDIGTTVRVPKPARKAATATAQRVVSRGTPGSRATPAPKATARVVATPTSVQGVGATSAPATAPAAVATSAPATAPAQAPTTVPTAPSVVTPPPPPTAPVSTAVPGAQATSVP